MSCQDCGCLCGCIVDVYLDPVYIHTLPVCVRVCLCVCTPTRLRPPLPLSHRALSAEANNFIPNISSNISLWH